MAAEVLHGISRTLFLLPAVGDFRSRQIGVFSGSAIVLLITYLTIRWMRVPSTRGRIAIGIAWTIMTVAFEIGFGLMLGYSWDGLAADYDLVRGGLMPIGLVVMALAPQIAARIRSTSS